MTQNIPAPHDPLRQLTRRLVGQVGQASKDHALIEPGDHVLVAISGGKDSYTMLDLLRQLQERAPFDFTLIAVNIDQGHPGYPRHVLEDYLAREGYPIDAAELNRDVSEPRQPNDSVAAAWLQELIASVLKLRWITPAICAAPDPLAAADGLLK